MTDQLRFPQSWREPKIPGYGTFPHPFAGREVEYEQVARAARPGLEQALLVGYRHIDTAFTYRNQDLVGAAANELQIPRGELFITSKLHPNNNTYGGALEKIEQALRLIWGDNVAGAYLDAFLIHYPGMRDPIGAWKGLLTARERGWIRHPGVSNFEIWHLEKLHQATEEYPQINQIELHPYIYCEQNELVDFCHSKGIAVEAYSPLAEQEVLDEPVLLSLARARGTTPARITLKWCMQHGARPIVGARNPEHIAENAEPYDFCLSEHEMQLIDVLGARKLIRVSLQWNWNPKTAPLGSSELASGIGLLVRKCSSFAGHFLSSLKRLFRWWWSRA